MFEIISKYVNSLRQKIILMFARALITGVNESGGLQVVQLDLGNDDSIDSVERIQNFGLTSFPVNGSEAIVLCIGGDRENPLVIATDSSEHRPKLAEGETALYNAFNRIVKLKNGNIEIGINTFKKLLKETFQSVYNSHTHLVAALPSSGSPPPTIPTLVPTQQSPASDLTSVLKAE